MNPTNFAIVGGGIIGLSTGLALKLRNPDLDVTVVEKEAQVGSHQTGHNSGVIHSGIYYAPGSLKAKLCVEGSRELMRFCSENGIPVRVTGKVIVATRPEQLPQLDMLLKRGELNGLKGVKKLSADGLREIEPNAKGVAALHVPATAIVDYGLVASTYAKLLTKLGGIIKTQTKICRVKRVENKWLLYSGQEEIKSDYIINCAGLFADRLARLCGHQPNIRIVPFRGEYYLLAKDSWPLVRTLIYPVPDPAFPFLGVHFTNRINGGVEAGPNAVLALKREGYQKTDFNIKDVLDIFAYRGFWKLAKKYGRVGASEIFRSMNKTAFVRSLQELVPAISADMLVGQGSGVRAQALDAGGKLVDDFCFLEADGALHVLNAPSPAATGSLAIGKYVAAKVARALGLD